MSIAKPKAHVNTPDQPDDLIRDLHLDAEKLRQYREALAEREGALNAYIEELQTLWCAWSGLSWYPGGQVMRSLVSRYEPDVVERSLRNVAHKVGTGYVRATGEAWVPYLYAVAKNMANGVDLGDPEEGQ